MLVGRCRFTSSCPPRIAIDIPRSIAEFLTRSFTFEELCPLDQNRGGFFDGEQDDLGSFPSAFVLLFYCSLQDAPLRTRRRFALRDRTEMRGPFFGKSDAIAVGFF